ncbi:hypothetical protein BC834DRAFT_167015 [Gloeopeniophorella convolvens]|nr:hypothetical protein BC834DRAFT_167015 [Gloeopeniophorella convolvens]
MSGKDGKSGGSAFSKASPSDAQAQSHSAKAGLQFPVGHVHCLLKRGNTRSALALARQTCIWLAPDIAVRSDLRFSLPCDSSFVQHPLPVAARARVTGEAVVRVQAHLTRHGGLDLTLVQAPAVAQGTLQQNDGTQRKGRGIPGKHRALELGTWDICNRAS